MPIVQPAHIIGEKYQLLAGNPQLVSGLVISVCLDDSANDIGLSGYREAGP